MGLGMGRGGKVSAGGCWGLSGLSSVRRSSSFALASGVGPLMESSYGQVQLQGPQGPNLSSTQGDAIITSYGLAANPAASAAAVALSVVQMPLSLEDPGKVMVSRTARGHEAGRGRGHAPRGIPVLGWHGWGAKVSPRQVLPVGVLPRGLLLWPILFPEEMTWTWLIFNTSHLALSPLPEDMVCVAMFTANL